MNIAICEDEKYWMETLAASVMAWGEAKGVSLNIEKFFTPHDLMKRVFSLPYFDLVFLDIYFDSEKFDGIKAADYLSTAGNKTPVIFVSSDGLRAADGYLVEAKGFLKKPIDEGKLTLFLDRALSGKKPPRFFEISADGQLVRVAYTDIVYIEVQNKSIICHTINNAVTFKGKLSEVMKELGSEEFLHVHKSFFVRKDKIYSVKPTYPYSIALNKRGYMVEVPMSRGYVASVLDAFTEFASWRMI